MRNTPSHVYPSARPNPSFPIASARLLPTLLLLFLPFLLSAQHPVDDFDPYAIGPTKVDLPQVDMNLKNVPFGHIIVLDNRIETGYFFIGEPFPDMPTWYTFGNSADVQNFLQTAIDSLKKTNDTLLINIKCLRVPNSMTILNGNGKGNTITPVRAHERLNFYAEAWGKSGPNTWTRIVSIRTYAEMEDPDYPENTAGLLFRKLLHYAATKEKPARSDKSIVHYPSDPVTFTLADINHPYSDEWKNLPIVKRKPSRTNGYYTHFNDFVKNKLTIPENDSIHVIYNSKDSIYTLNRGPWVDTTQDINTYTPWAVSSEGKLYYNVGWNKYVLLEPKNNTFYFYLPHSLPDAYGMLGKAILAPEDSTDVNANTKPFSEDSDDALSNLGGMVLNAIIKHEINKERKMKKLRQPYVSIPEGKDYGYRSCYLDLDNGDIVY